MDGVTPLGTEKVIDGQRRVHYYGYWIKAYEVPADTLLTKKRLISALTRRLFNHVEHGLNVPGIRLDEARAAYDSESEPRARRIKGAMLAGALFNRATDIFTKLVELQALGVSIEPDNALMQECGEHLREALALGKMVLHRSGDEGIDELWGEPLKAFLLPVEEFYRSRYIKIAQTMRAIDSICAEMTNTFTCHTMFEGVGEHIRHFGEAAKVKCETLRTDPDIFDVWTSFVVCGESITGFAPNIGEDPNLAEQRLCDEGVRLLRSGEALISYISRARVPMPKSTEVYFERCAELRRACELDTTSVRFSVVSSKGHGC